MKILSYEEFVDYSLKMLTFIDEFCIKNNITYFLAAGTLLGCVRHKGFIPWDDDVDICMTRQNFKKFTELFPKSERYVFECVSNTNGWVLPYGKVRDLYTVRYNSITNEKIMPEQGLDIDVFIIDGYPNSSLIRKIHFSIQNYMFNKIYLRVLCWKEKKGLIRVFSHMLSLVLSPTFMAKCLYKFAGIWSAEKTKYAGCMVGLYRKKMELAYSDSFMRPQYSLFENRYFPIPINPEDVLESIYGSDYMTPPPEDKRQSTHTSYIVWRD